MLSTPSLPWIGNRTAAQIVAINAASPASLYAPGTRLTLSDTAAAGTGYTLVGTSFSVDGGGNKSIGLYLAWFPFNQPASSGIPRDYACGLSLYPMASYNPSAFFLTPGKLLTGAGANLSLGAPPELNLSAAPGSNLLIEVGVTRDTAAGNEMLMGNTDLTAPGFQLYVTAAGKLRLVLRTTATATSAVGATTVTDNVEHVTAVYFSGDQGVAFVFVDGSLELTLTFPGSTNAITPTQSLGLGAYNSTLQTTFAASFRNLHIIRFGANPVNIAGLVQKLAVNITRPLTEAEITAVVASQRLVQSIEIGQSNEYSAAPTRFQTVFGYPSNNGGITSNFQVREVEKIAMRRGISVKPINAAIGSSSLPISFCGLCKGAWVSGTYVAGGDAVTNAGNLYQCDDVIGSLNPTTTAPTGTVATFSTADGRAWKYLGAASGIDVANHVYRRGERGFDPKFQLQFYALPALQKVANFDETWVTIQIGQTDAGNNTITQTIMEDAYKSIIDYLLFYNVTRIYLGNTIGCAAAGIDAAYMSKIFPARTAVLAYYAGNPKVFAGADLRTLLGVLPAVSSFSPGVPQLEPTGYHGNEYVYELGAEARYQNKLALGHI